MTITWLALVGMLIMNAIWLDFSRLSFANSNWESIVRLIAGTSIAFGLCGLIKFRLKSATDRLGVVFRKTTGRVELYASATLVFGLLVANILTYCYLGAAAGLALQDGRLAQIDQWMGFDWVGFVSFTNNSELASWLLVKAYESAVFVLPAILLWLCISGQGERLAEFLALACITSIGIAAGMMVLPAAGAYAFYHLSLGSYEHFGAGAGMWHYDLLMALRTGAVSVIDFATPNSNTLVTFPSGHTVLAIIMTYATRGSRWTFVPALAINTMMLVSTIPVGGHHLFDVLVGGLIAASAIWVVRRPFADPRSWLARPALDLPIHN
jgi:membrane-associated phospholipid phosphatase